MRLFRTLLLVPVAAAILLFAYANREAMTVYFDPIGGSGLAPVEAPAFLVLLVAAGLGVIAGGATTWFGQSRHRRAAREAQAEAARLRQELQAARGAPALARRA